MQKRILSLLVLLVTAVMGAWAQTTYKVSVKEGTEDANKWEITPAEATTTGVAASTAVSAKYSGTKMVKSVKARKKAAKTDLLSGVFSVSASKKVNFSKGNLRYASGAWSFFDNQYDYYTSYSADAWDKFGWSTSATTYGMNTSTDKATYSGDFVDWGATMGTGWFTLSSDEWTYLLNTRTSGGTVFGTSSACYAHATINTDGTGVNGMILFPDGVDIASTEVTTAGTVNNTSAYATKCTTAQWSALAAKGCVFLPAAGFRGQASVNGAGSYGYYWSSSPYTSDAYRAYLVFFSSGTLNPASYSYRNVGYSVRLVQATSDAAPATPALSITSPSVGQVIGSDGKNYAYGSLPTGVTAVAKICYVSGNNGLALALTDEEGYMNWSTAQTTCAAHTPAFTGGTWKLASKDEWSNMISAAGSYSALRDGFSSVGGTNMQSDNYWSSTENGPGAWYYYFSSGGWYEITKGSNYYIRACLEFTVEQAAKEPATVTTAPTGAAVVGVGKTTALVSGGAADGGTLMYAVTTTNTKPTSTDGFSASVPTAQTITASGKVYVWYYVKADDTHSDSEIAATAIEVPVADIIWDVTNVSDLDLMGNDQPYEKEGITLSCNADHIQAVCYVYDDPTVDGIVFQMSESGGFTFTAPTGKAFTKIEMTLIGSGGGGWDVDNLGTGWEFALDMSYTPTVTWKGSAAASTVDLLKDANMFYGEHVKSIAFYLSE